MKGRTCDRCGHPVGHDLQVVDAFDSVEYYCGDCSENSGEAER